MVIGAMIKRRRTDGGANETFFRIDDGPPTAGITQVSRRKEEHARGKTPKAAARVFVRRSFVRSFIRPSVRSLARSLARSPARSRFAPALVLTPGIFRRQTFREIYGEVTAWIAMNSAHPPLSGLVIVLKPFGLAGVTRAYT